MYMNIALSDPAYKCVYQLFITITVILDVGRRLGRWGYEYIIRHPGLSQSPTKKPARQPSKATAVLWSVKKDQRST